MILLRRLGGPVFALNPDLIERAESTPDTVLTMVGGNKYVVCETLIELTDLIRDHRSRIIASAEAMSDPRNHTAHSGSAQAALARSHDSSVPASSTSTHSSSKSSTVVPLRPKDV